MILVGEIHRQQPNAKLDLLCRWNRASDSILGSYACNDLNMLTSVGSGSYSNDAMGDRQSDPSGASYVVNCAAFEAIIFATTCVALYTLVAGDTD